MTDPNYILPTVQGKTRIKRFFFHTMQPTFVVNDLYLIVYELPRMNGTLHIIQTTLVVNDECRIVRDLPGTNNSVPTMQKHNLTANDASPVLHILPRNEYNPSRKKYTSKEYDHIPYNPSHGKSILVRPTGTPSRQP